MEYLFSVVNIKGPTVMRLIRDGVDLHIYDGKLGCYLNPSEMT